MASRMLAVATMREEVFFVATRTAWHVVDGVDPVTLELRAHFAPEVDVVAIAMLDERELLGHLGTDFEAADTDARTDRGDARLHRSLAHDLEGFPDYLAMHTSPTRVDRGDAPGVRIGDEDRNAIGHAHAHGDAGLRRDEGVCLDPLQITAIRDRDRISVHLLDLMQIRG